MLTSTTTSAHLRRGGVDLNINTLTELGEWLHKRHSIAKPLSLTGVRGPLRILEYAGHVYFDRGCRLTETWPGSDLRRRELTARLVGESNDSMNVPAVVTFHPRVSPRIAASSMASLAKPIARSSLHRVTG